jgi:hypothetical protein
MGMTYLVKIGGTELTKLTKYAVERNKLWSDSDRTLSGSLKGTLIGVFPKLLLEFGYLTESELKTIVGLLEPASFNVSWWDSRTGTYKVGVYYAGDYSYPLFDKAKGLYEPFGVNLIPYNKLS